MSLLWLQLAYNITDLVDKNQKLNAEVNNTNKALNEALDHHKKLESSCEALRQDKLTVAALAEEWKSRFHFSEEQLKVTTSRLASVTVAKDSQLSSVEEECRKLRQEIIEVEKERDDRLLLGFQLMKEALKEVEPTFSLERLDTVSLPDLFPRALAAISAESPAPAASEAQPSAEPVPPAPSPADPVPGFFAAGEPDTGDAPAGAPSSENVPAPENEPGTGAAPSAPQA